VFFDWAEAMVLQPQNTPPSPGTPRALTARANFRERDVGSPISLNEGRKALSA
jgi:hypothetical protein